MGPQTEIQVHVVFSSEDASDNTTLTSGTQRNETAGSTESRDYATNSQVRIEVQDPTAGTLMELRLPPDGRVRLMLCRNNEYRLRLSGPKVQDEQIDSIRPNRGDKVITVTLRPRETKQKSKSTKGTVGAGQLKISARTRHELEHGDKALKADNLPEAERYYRAALHRNPKFAEAANNLGVVLMRQGRTEEGRAAFEQAVKLNDKYAAAEINLAKSELDAKHYEPALALSKQALTTEPLNTSALFICAESSYFLSHYEDTVRYARSLHALPHNGFALAHYLAANSLQQLNQSDAAIAQYELFLSEDPADSNAARARQLLAMLSKTRAE